MSEPRGQGTGRRRRKRWSWSTGEYGQKVRVFARRNGRLYGWIAGVKVALKRPDSTASRAWAKAWAKDQHKQLVAGRSTVADPAPTAARIFAAYLATQMPRKRSRTSRYQDARASKMWTRVLGAGKDLHRVTLGEWQQFIDARGSGAIDCHGEPAREPATSEDPKRRPVRARAVEADLEWLRGVIRWATKWQDGETGRYLMTEDPTRGYAIPTEANPRRPVATADRYEQLAAVAAKVHPMLPVLLALAYHTARRISAILALRYEDLRLDDDAIVWPAATDKRGRSRWAPLPRQARVALDRWLAAHPGIGAAYLFPSPADPTRSVSRDMASSWLEQAHRVAKLKRLDGSLWHAFRRGWATAHKHLPAQDVAAVGGWADLGVLQSIYQQPDPETMRRVVADATELREANA